MKLPAGIKKEFLKYCVVGGAAFVVDYGLMSLVENLLLPGRHYAAVTVGFIAGLIVNYLLSLYFVFTDKQEQGKTKKGFLIFTIVGVIGLGLNYLGVFLLTDCIGINLQISKIFIAGVVLIWNYVARKILVFK